MFDEIMQVEGKDTKAYSESESYTQWLDLIEMNEAI